MQKPGTLIVVGTGIQMVRQITEEARYWIKKADQVLVGSSPAELEWIRRALDAVDRPEAVPHESEPSCEASA